MRPNSFPCQILGNIPLTANSFAITPAAAPHRYTIFRRSPWVDVVFWLAYGFFWHLVFAPARLTPANLAISGILTCWQAVATYAHIRLLLEPRYAGRLSIPLYALGAMGIILGASALSWTTNYLYFRLFLPDFALTNFLANAQGYWLGAILGGMTMAIAFTGAIYLFGRRREDDKRSRELERARQEAELAYLRGQLNPHFLFNALNSIHVLIPRSPDEAQQALEGFSELLRYQLYRAEESYVPLAEEITHLQKFAELNRLRLEEDFVFQFRTPEESGKYQLPPLLLLPLLENAFKYCPKLGGDIQGKLDITNDQLQFTLTNKVAENIVATESSGIGLSNIRRRMDILFPAAYRLEAGMKGQRYEVYLEIPLTQ